MVVPQLVAVAKAPQRFQRIEKDEQEMFVSVQSNGAVEEKKKSYYPSDSNGWNDSLPSNLWIVDSREKDFHDVRLGDCQSAEYANDGCLHVRGRREKCGAQIFWS